MTRRARAPAVQPAGDGGQENRKSRMAVPITVGHAALNRL